MKELNRCAACGKWLVTNETVHAVDGKLYCCRPCAITDIVGTLMAEPRAAAQFGRAYEQAFNSAYEQAKEHYDECAEELATEDILNEDFYEVNVSVHFFRTIKMPKYWTEQDLPDKVHELLKDGKITVGPEEFDHMRFDCELVEDNS